MTPRDEFAGALAQLRALPAVHQQQCDALEAEYKAEVIETARPHAPKRRQKNLNFHKALDVLGKERVGEIMERFKPRADALYDAQRQQRDSLKARLDELAPQAEIRKSDTWVPFAQVYVSSYHTQGLGAATYAHNVARLSALEPVRFGVETVVVYDPGVLLLTEHQSKWGPDATRGYMLESYIVAIKVESDVDVEIIRHRPALTIREWLKACWAMGCNPRVLNPFLPPGLEEKLGIDYFGRDIPARTT